MNIVHTMASQARIKVPKLRFVSPELKLQIVAQCDQPGASIASIAAVALGHAINANIVHRWIREHGQGALTTTSPAFIPVTMNEEPRQATVPAPPSVIRASKSNWPLQDGAACAHWLREWLE